MARRLPTRIPRQWSWHVKSGVLHAISLAGVVLCYARGRAMGRCIQASGQAPEYMITDRRGSSGAVASSAPHW